MFDPHSGPALADADFQKAWDGAAHPEPLQGYLFCDIERGPDGRALDRHARAGLCGYPVVAAANHPVILMLLDFNAPDEDRWVFYTANSQKVPGAVRAWPPEAAQRTVWTRLRKYTPQEGLAEAQRRAAR